MPLRPSVTRLVIGVLSLMFVASFSSDAGAKPIELENDVSVEWGNFRCYPTFNLFACPNPASIDSTARLFTESERGDLALTIDFHTTDREIEEFQFLLFVGYPSLEEVLIGGVPLVLKTDRLSVIEDQTLHLSDFGPLGSLPAGDLVFSLGGTFFGNSGFGDCKDDKALGLVPDPDNPGGFLPPDLVQIITVDGKRVPNRPCDKPGEASTLVPASITFAGGAAVGVPEDVPEPGAAILLLSGLGAAGWRRYRGSRASS